MRKLIFLIAVVMFSCSDEKTETNTDMGCSTGVNSSGDRVLIRCATQKQHMAGDNVGAGGIPTYGYYTDHQWEKCENCQ
jgi:hypothetical protein